MKTIIIVIMLAVAADISFGQKTDTQTFENQEPCKVLEIQNMSGTFDTIIRHGGVYLEKKEGKIFANICYKNGGTIYGNPIAYSFNDDVLLLEMQRQKAFNPTGATGTLIVKLRFSKKDRKALGMFGK